MTIGRERDLGSLDGFSREEDIFPQEQKDRPSEEELGTQLSPDEEWERFVAQETTLGG